ncbi:MAG: helix-turn-helix domain-containing protein [Lachnospiraceae bacterium]
MLIDEFYVEEEKKAEMPFQCHTTTLIKDKVYTRPHIHSKIEMLYCIRGKMHVFVDGKKYEFNPKDMILIMPQAVHSIYAVTDEEGYFAVIKFDPDLLLTPLSYSTEFMHLLPFITKNENTKKFFLADELKESGVDTAVGKIMKEAREKNYGYDTAVRLYINEIFLWMMREWRPEEESADRKKLKEKILPSLSYIEENFCGRINLADAAKSCHMSVSLFSRSFKSVVGLNYSHYILLMRLTKAKKLLVTTEQSITEVGSISGFSSTSYFITQFKEHTGITPYKYRQIAKSSSHDEE